VPFFFFGHPVESQREKWASSKTDRGMQTKPRASITLR